MQLKYFLEICTKFEGIEMPFAACRQFDNKLVATKHNKLKANESSKRKPYFITVLVLVQYWMFLNFITYALYNWEYCFWKFKIINVRKLPRRQWKAFVAIIIITTVKQEKWFRNHRKMRLRTEDVCNTLLWEKIEFCKT